MASARQAPSTAPSAEEMNRSANKGEKRPPINPQSLATRGGGRDTAVPEKFLPPRKRQPSASLAPDAFATGQSRKPQECLQPTSTQPAWPTPRARFRCAEARSARLARTPAQTIARSNRQNHLESPAARFSSACPSRCRKDPKRPHPRGNT